MPELLLRKDLGKRAYRLKCRFKIEPCPGQSRLDREKVTVAERFVADMHKQGWENQPGYGFRMRGPFPMVVPTVVRVPSRLSSREMFPHVMQGARFPDTGHDSVSLVPTLEFSEWWEYEISGVFVRETILMERPDPHEEIRN